MRKAVIIFIFILACIIKIDAQIQNYRHEVFASYAIINDYAIDENTNKIYYVLSTKSSGNQLVHKLIAVDANSGAILFTGPSLMLGTDSEVKSIVFINNQIFIAGNDEVSGNQGFGFIYKVNPATGLIDGNWTHSLGGGISGIYNIRSMTADQINLYLTGHFPDNLIYTVALNILTGNRSSSVIIGNPPFFEDTPFKKLEVTATEIIALADDGLYFYDKTNFSFIKKLSAASHTGLTSDFLLRNDTAYITGDFFNPFSGKKNIACLKYEYNSNSLQSWNFKDSNCVNSNQNKTRAIAKYGNHLIVGGVIENKFCTTANFYFANSIYTDSLIPFNGIPRNGFPVYNDSIKTFKILGNKLFLLSNKKTFWGNNLQTDTSAVGSYCLTPNSPTSFINKKMNVCAGEQSVAYSIASQGSSLSYNWSYSGTGTTINGSGSSISIDFSNMATSGFLSVNALSECGTQSDTINIFITINPLPNVFAGNDTSLTCNLTQTWIHANSTTPNVSFSWQLPDNSNSATDSVLAKNGGNYILTATINSTGCKNYDTLKITYDTIPPTINVSSSYTINKCFPGDTLVLATTNNNNDSIYWIGANSPNNPALLSNPNNIPGGANYIVVAVAKNGCADSTIVNVKNAFSFPKIIVPPSAYPITVFGLGAYKWDELTCLKDSILLKFTCSNPSVKINIKRSAAYNYDIVANNIYVKHGGMYYALLTDTITQCNAAQPIYIGFNKNLPAINYVNLNPSLTCSNITTQLNATNSDPDVNFNWSGPNSFTSSNPAVVNQGGNYIVVATDPNSGCSQSDTITVIQQNILLLNSTADTTVCKGDSVTITSASIGGTPNFIYSWSNAPGNNSSINVNPTSTTHYIVHITDANNCIGTDTITITIPPPIKDSTLAYAPCDLINPNGQIHVFASGGIPPYQYAINNGSFQNNNIFNYLNFGNYNFTIQDDIGCTYNFTTSISNQSNAPKADFIVSTTMMQADTFVVVDISNPRPDTVIWTFPASVTVINNNIFAPVIISSDTGVVSVSMKAQWGPCISTLTKQVQFIKPDTIAAHPKGNGIESITIFPNPNTGQFSVEVKLYKKQSFAIYVYNAQGVEQKRATFSEINYGLSAFNLSNPIPGTYLIKVVSEFDSKSKTFMITQ